MDRKLKALYLGDVAAFTLFLFGNSVNHTPTIWLSIAAGLPLSSYLCAKIPTRKELEDKRNQQLMELQSQLSQALSEKNWLEQLNASQAQKLLDERTQVEGQLRDRVSELTSQVEDIRSDHLRELAELQLDYSTEREKLEENHRLDIARKLAEITRLTQQYEGQIQALKTDHDEAVAAINAQIENLVTSANQAKVEAQKQLAEAEAQKQQNAEVEKQLQGFKEQLKLANDELRVRRSEAQLKYERNEFELNKRLDDVKAENLGLNTVCKRLQADLVETKELNRELWAKLYGKETDRATAAIQSVLAAAKCPTEVVSSDCETIVLRPISPDGWDKKSLIGVAEKLPAFVPGLETIPKIEMMDGTITITLNYQEENVSVAPKLYDWTDAKTEASGFVVCGNTGAAKSSVALWLLGLLTEDKPKQVLVLDVHAQMNSWANYGLYTLHRQQDVVAGLRACLDELIRRKDQGINYPELLVVFDEIAATRMNCEDKDEKAFVDQTMLLLGAEGRKFGITLIASGGDKGARELAGFGLERLTPVDKMSAYCEQK